MMPLTYKLSLVVNGMVSFFETQKSVLGIKSVYYGDQTTFPDTPSLCVEPGAKSRELSGMTYRLDNNFRVFLLIYHTGIEGTRVIQQVCDAITEDVEDAINRESAPVSYGGGTQFGGIITSGHVTSVEHGYRVLSDGLMRLNRLTWEGFSKTGLLEA